MAMTNDVPDIELLIRSYLNSLTKTETKVAKYILENIKDIAYLSVTELADKSGVGETTVLRFCRKLNYKGFQDFKISLARASYQQIQHPDEIKPDDDITILRDKVIQSHTTSINSTAKLLNPDKLEAAVKNLIRANAIHFFGSGTSGLTAQQAAHVFMRIGKLTDAKQDNHFQAISASLLSKEDVAVGISVSGETKDTIDNLKIAKDKGVTTICITSSARSSITEIADIDLIIAAKENPLEGSSVSSILSQLSVIDVLYTGVLTNNKKRALKYREQTARAVSIKQH